MQSGGAKRIKEIFKTQHVMEGAGVKLRRGFGNAEVPRFDPFLLFDDFSAKNPADYLAGFPWHPHRGIETVTYILDGNVRHRDSIGSSGVIGAGDLQWMSAGSGIIHEEMPEGTGGLKGFQLWINLSQKGKMSKPNYQEVTHKDIPTMTVGGNAEVRLIAGAFETHHGPVKDIMAEPLYIDVTVLPEKDFSFPVVDGYTTFIYIFDGALGTGVEGSIIYEKGTILLYAREGSEVVLRAGGAGARFLLVSGKPLNEKVAWYGPIVMNSEEELHTAFRELEQGSFIKE